MERREHEEVSTVSLLGYCVRFWTCLSPACESNPGSWFFIVSQTYQRVTSMDVCSGQTQLCKMVICSLQGHVWASPLVSRCIYAEFCNGSFVVHKTKRLLSTITLDHAHEQVNAIVKSEGGAVGLTDNPALRSHKKMDGRWSRACKNGWRIRGSNLR